MLRLGITGGLAAGKSVAARFFTERGGHHFDADLEAKQILLESQAVHAEIAAAFGEDLISPAGTVDTELLAARSFAEPALQQTLNGIIHPLVIAEAQRQIAKAAVSGSAWFILDAPLLFEAGLEAYLDRTLLIVADEALRIERALARGRLAEDDIRRRIGLQMPDSEKRRRADIVIENNGSMAEFEEKLKRAYLELQGSPSA